MPRPNYKNIKRYEAFKAFKAEQKLAHEAEQKKAETMAIIHHFDEFSGRFIELEVSDEQIQKKRVAAQETERRGLVRGQVVRRCLRLLDSGAAQAEHVIGQAFNSGFVIGAKQADLTQLDMDVLDNLEELGEEGLRDLRCHAPNLTQAILDLRKASTIHGSD